MLTAGELARGRGDASVSATRNAGERQSDHESDIKVGTSKSGLATSRWVLVGGTWDVPPYT